MNQAPGPQTEHHAAIWSGGYSDSDGAEPDPVTWLSGVTMVTMVSSQRWVCPVGFLDVESKMSNTLVTQSRPHDKQLVSLVIKWQGVSETIVVVRYYYIFSIVYCTTSS